MDGTIRARDLSDIIRWIAPLALAVCAPAGAQLLDSTVGDIVEHQIDRQVVDRLAQDLATHVEQQVTTAVEQQVTTAVEQQVTTAVEQQVTSAVEQTIESKVVDAVEQTVEAAVVDTVEHAVESTVVDTIEQAVESGVADQLARQLDAGVVKKIEQGAEGALEETLEHGVGGVLDDVGEGLERAEGGAAPVGGAPNGDQRRAPAERFAAAIDAAGRAVERDVWVILVPAEHAARIASWGFTIRERRDLGTLDRVLLRVDAPEDRDIVQAALDLALDAPGTVVDFNHLYRGSADVQRVDGLPARAGSSTPALPLGRLAIGSVDSAVATDHAALRAADIVQEDFVPFEAKRPLTHGTAVASILVGEARDVEARLRGARLYAASVFFEDAEGQPAATTASLVAALEWLAGQGVRTINMSLAGPANRVLETAVGAITERGAVIVAAVGNNGPKGEPLYPAAYAGVVGVTALDSANRVYRYANRGRQVTFAAPGVKIAVARAAGGYGAETGTSMAAPYAAAIIARSLSLRAGKPAVDVLTALEAAAIDLGAKGFDDVFGFGLIAAVDGDSPLKTSR